jgi:Protein of unknown function (DUF4232)
VRHAEVVLKRPVLGAVLAVVAVLAAGCSSGKGHASGTVPTTVAPTTTSTAPRVSIVTSQPTSSTTTVPASTEALPCKSTQLTVTLGSGGGATGHLVQDFVLRNMSAKTCTLQSAVSVHQYDRRGSLLGGRSQEAQAFTFPAVPARRVVLRSGGYASFATEVGDVNTDGLSYSVQCPTPARTDFVLPNGGGVLRSPKVLGGCDYAGITVTVSNIVAGREPPTY